MAVAREVEVAVVGAGPVGLTAAAELARHGVAVCLLDRRSGPVEHSNAAVLHVRSLEVLEAMGIADRFVAASFPLQYVSLYAFGRRLGGIRLYGIDGPYSGPRTIGQQHVERLLGERLRELGVTVERSVEVTGLAAEPDGVSLAYRQADGAEAMLRARHVIGCDGAHSTIREAIGIAQAGERYEGFEFTHADCTVRWRYPSGRAYTFVEKDRFVALFPFDGEGAYRVLCARSGKAQGGEAAPTLDELQALVRSTADPAAELSDPAWLARWHSGHHLAERFREGRVFLAGDAAHVHVPVGGQGMNIGMQDSFNLCWKLAAVLRGTAPPALLDTYNAERHPIAEDVIRGTDRSFHLMVQPNDFAGFALKLFGSSVVALEGVQERLRRFLGEVSFGYRTSALAEDHGGTIGPIAGERAIDGVGVRARDMRTIRLLQALNGTRWQLLIFAGWDAESADPALVELGRKAHERFGRQLGAILITPGRAPAGWTGEVIYDRERLLHDRYGVRNAAYYLIRPDWYVGCRAPAARGQAVLAYLERWLVPG